MDTIAFQQYGSEAGTWLKRGRFGLIAGLIGRHAKEQPAQILEVGAGIGQNVPTLASFGTVDVVEISDIGLQELGKLPDIRNTFRHPIPFDLDDRYDVIGAFDVVEHIDDDDGAVRWMVDHLTPGGILVLTVPAYQWLYSEHDAALHHFRRYRRGALVNLVPRTAEVIQSGYFNTVLFPLAVASRLHRRCPVPDRMPDIEFKKQSGKMPPIVDSLFGGILSLETAAVRYGLDPPYGLSAYWVVRNI